MVRKIKILKDELESWVLPESVEVWKRHGWHVHDEDQVETGSTGPTDQPAPSDSPPAPEV